MTLMHERYGLVEHTRDQAMRGARDGYAVLAPNSFFRHPDPAALNAGNARYGLTDPESIELINVALATLRKHGGGCEQNRRGRRPSDRAASARLRCGGADRRPRTSGTVPRRSANGR
jgi:dienelactone hydrolase